MKNEKIYLVIISLLTLLSCNKDEISEYFYMRYLNGFYLYPDELTNAEIELTQSPRAYLRWLDTFNIDYHKNLLIKIENFIDSKKFKLIDKNLIDEIKL